MENNNNPTNTNPVQTPAFNSSNISQQPVNPQPSNQDTLFARIESITENLVDEKWKDLVEEVQKIIDWKEKSSTQLTKFSNDLEKLKSDFETLHQGILGKVQAYDGSISKVNVELSALSGVFKDTIPLFVESVKELKDITSSLKK